MELARKILFYVFLLIYLVLCPFIILYSFGYIYHPGTKDISQTGLIYLSSTPAGAHVYLEKSRFKNKTPTTIRELNPGEYQVSVRLKNYRPWSHHITIEAGKSVVFKNILLLPERFNKVNVSPNVTYRNLTTIRGTNYLILQKGSKIKEFYIYELPKEVLRALTDRDSEYDDFAVSTIFTEDKSKLIIMYGGSLWNKKYFLIDFDDKTHSLTEITDFFSEHPNSIVWTNNFPKDIFAVYDDYINRLDIQNISVYPRYFDNIKGFGLGDKWLYVLGMDNVILKSTLDKEQEIILFDDIHLGKDLFKKSRFYNIQRIDKDILLFWGNRGDLITTIPPYRIIDEGVFGINYNESANILLFWTKNSIWTADFNKTHEQDFLFKERVRLNDIYDEGTDIGQCFWVYVGTHLLFKDKNDVYLLELAPDGKYHKEYIVEVKENTEIYYNKIDGSLYYIDQKGNLMKIKLLPKEKMIFAPLMEESKS